LILLISNELTHLYEEEKGRKGEREKGRKKNPHFLDGLKQSLTIEGANLYTHLPNILVYNLLMMP